MPGAGEPVPGDLYQSHLRVAKQVVICLPDFATRGGAAAKTCQTYDYVLRCNGYAVQLTYYWASASSTARIGRRISGNAAT
jgi:hypothetical protein